MTTVTMRQMLEAGVHFGHKKRFWNPKMAPYIYGARHEIHIINLEETMPLFNHAMKFMSDVAARRGRVLFVGTKMAAREIVKEEAARCGMPYVNYRWLGGMLTNYKTIRQSIKRLKELEACFENPEKLEGMTKKETLQLSREKDKLEHCLAGIKDMGGLPDVLFIIDVGIEKIAIAEAKKLGIPVVGIVDTNTSPETIEYPIPGNDDAQRSIRLYCQTVADIIIEKRGKTETKQPKANVAKEQDEKIIIKKRKVVKKTVAEAETPALESESAEVRSAPVKKAEAKKAPVAKKATPAAKKAVPAAKKAASTKKEDKPKKD